MVRQEPGDLQIVGEEWHTDTTMVAEPPMGAILYAVEVPPMAAAPLRQSIRRLRGVSDGMKRILEGLRGV